MFRLKLFRNNSLRGLIEKVAVKYSQNSNEKKTATMFLKSIKSSVSR